MKEVLKIPILYAKIQICMLLQNCFVQIQQLHCRSLVFQKTTKEQLKIEILDHRKAVDVSFNYNSATNTPTQQKKAPNNQNLIVTLVSGQPAISKWW